VAKKADLELAAGEHAAQLVRAVRAEADRNHRESLALAVASLATIQEAMAFHRRFVKAGDPPVAAVDRVLRLAPPLFARPALDALAAAVAGWKKADRESLPGLAERLSAARREMAAAAELWAGLRAGSAPARPVDGRDRFVAVWVEMGLLVPVGRRPTSRFVPVTDLRRASWGKCPGCGHQQRTATLDLLKPIRCDSCRRVAPFVLTRRQFEEA
jgi:hypothetical protein